MRPVNLRFLRTFVAIRRRSGFARAATRLSLTQSAASRQIAKMGRGGGFEFVHPGRVGSRPPRSLLNVEIWNPTAT
jgi:hypothetical protein